MVLAITARRSCTLCSASDILAMSMAVMVVAPMMPRALSARRPVPIHPFSAKTDCAARGLENVDAGAVPQSASINRADERQLTRPTDPRPTCRSQAGDVARHGIAL